MKPYTKEAIEAQVTELMAAGQEQKFAIGTAVARARMAYKRDNPATSSFPVHLAPQGIMNTYWKGGELNGEAE